MQQNVVKVEFYEQEAAEASQAPDSYKGLPIYASRGLHAHVMQLVQRCVPAGATILELGAGTGAMSQRLTDGYYNVTASDLVAKNFRLQLPFQEADLNTNFSQLFGQTFDAIVCMELIEHLENPWNFFREAKRLLIPGGRLFLTTPNTESALSMCYQMRHGHHLWFSDADLKSAGHITPLTSRQLRIMARETGMSIKSISSFGDTDKIATPKMRLLSRAIRALSRPSLHQGEILVMVCVNGEES